VFLFSCSPMPKPHRHMQNYAKDLRATGLRPKAFLGGGHFRMQNMQKSTNVRSLR
jgi:hypothetical protein